MPKIKIPTHAKIENLKTKPPPKKWDLQAIADDRPKHSCEPCEFFRSQYDRNSSRVIKLYERFCNDPELVPHYAHPNDFDDPDYKFSAMRNVYMVALGKRCKQVADLTREKLQLQREKILMGEEMEKMREELDRFRKMGQVPFGQTQKNPAPLNKDSEDEARQCPRCERYLKNLMTYRDHIQKCGVTVRCPFCNVVKMKSSMPKHKKVCEKRHGQVTLSFNLFAPDGVTKSKDKV